MEKTHLGYLENMDLLTIEAQILDVLQEKENTIMVLNQTIFYPQGGGQPSDTGIIKGPAGIFRVNEARFVDGVVKHIGIFEEGTLKGGDEVQCIVDKEPRALYSRIHSAGHVLDMVVGILNLSWKPGRGFHFPEGPYIEYSGKLEGIDLDELKEKMTDLSNKIIQKGETTRVLFIDKDKMAQYCHFVPDRLPVGKPSRVVLYGDFGVPCGGTHVQNLAEIKQVVIRKIKRKGDTIRVGYNVVK
jgi:Ser-tRNA(Ala) deacylase AlaX